MSLRIFQNEEDRVFEIREKLETEEIEARASHLNQKVIILCRSSTVFIFEVEYFSSTKGKSSTSIHSQLSIITISSIHPFFISTFI
jgi:hypothetical protein